MRKLAKFTTAAVMTVGLMLPVAANAAPADVAEPALVPASAPATSSFGMVVPLEALPADVETFEDVKALFPADDPRVQVEKITLKEAGPQYAAAAVKRGVSFGVRIYVTLPSSDWVTIMNGSIATTTGLLGFIGPVAPLVAAGAAVFLADWTSTQLKKCPGWKGHFNYPIGKVATMRNLTPVGKCKK